MYIPVFFYINFIITQPIIYYKSIIWPATLLSIKGSNSKLF